MGPGTEAIGLGRVGIAYRCGRWPCSDNPCFGGKAPNRIKPVHVIDRTHFHVSRILAFAQCRRDARHHCRRDAPDMTLGSTMNMAAENGDDPPGVLQSLALCSTPGGSSPFSAAMF